MNVQSIMIVGVGGQGTLLASKLLGNALVAKGYDVKVSEVHGMSQRGGSVVTYVRYGEYVSSPIIDRGEADIIVAFEQLEAYRWLPFLRPGGKMIMSTHRIDPMPVITGAASYPPDIAQKLRTAGADVTAVDAQALAKQAGSEKAVNVVLLGVMARFLSIDIDDWRQAIRKTVPERFAELNLHAFDLGYSH